MILLAGACGVSANPGIPAGGDFRVGGSAHGSFRAYSEDTGPVAVPVIAGAPCGRRAQLTMPAPGAGVDATFPAGAVVVFVDKSARDAPLRVQIVGIRTCPWVARWPVMPEIADDG